MLCNVSCRTSWRLAKLLRHLSLTFPFSSYQTGVIRLRSDDKASHSIKNSTIFFLLKYLLHSCEMWLWLLNIKHCLENAKKTMRMWVISLKKKSPLIELKDKQKHMFIQVHFKMQIDLILDKPYHYVKSYRWDPWVKKKDVNLIHAVFVLA